MPSNYSDRYVLSASVKSSFALLPDMIGGWSGPPAPMPNSEGCIHAYPESIRTVWKLLTADDMGVVVRDNTGGKLPYPYKSQGLLSVFLMGE